MVVELLFNINSWILLLTVKTKLETCIKRTIKKVMHTENQPFTVRKC